MNHFSAKAVSNYLNRFERAFAGKATDGSAGTPTEYPHNFFNDSYEVYGADWTDDLFEQFARRRGYKLEHFLPDFLSKDRTETTRSHYLRLPRNSCRTASGELHPPVDGLGAQTWFTYP